MTADEFATRLAAARPTREFLISTNVPEEIIDEIRASYSIVLRSTEQGFESSDAVIDLLDRYDVSMFDICSIKFNKSPELAKRTGRPDILIFASFDADLIAHDQGTNQVLFVDGTDRSFVMMTLARDGGSFLDAIIFLVEAMQSRVPSKDIAKRCAELAGSPEAIGFYEMLTG